MRTMRAFTAITILLAAGIPSATAQDKAKGMGHNLPPLVKVTIAGFADGGEIPAKYTCVVQPNAVSLAIQWSDVPAGTASFAIIFHDPDPMLAKGTADVLHAKLDIRRLPLASTY